MNDICKTMVSPIFGAIRIAGTEEKPLFCLSDVCRALDIKNPSDCKSRLSREGVVTAEGVSQTTNQYGTTTSQKVMLTYINEPNFYKCVFMSRKPNAEQFQNWVFDEVLPSIRHDGGYMISKDNETEEDLMARALIVAQATLKRREERIKALEIENHAKDKEIVELSSTISDMKPKANYVDTILASEETVTTTQIAQDYGKSAKAFNIILRNFGIQHKVGRQWILYAKYLPYGYVHSETVPIFHTNGTSGFVMHTKWTQKGRLFLYNELKNRGIIPTIEQESVKR